MGFQFFVSSNLVSIGFERNGAAKGEAIPDMLVTTHHQLKNTEKNFNLSQEEIKAMKIWSVRACEGNNTKRSRIEIFFCFGFIF